MMCNELSRTDEIKHLHLIELCSVEGVMSDFPEAISIQHPEAIKQECNEVTERKLKLDQIWHQSMK